MDDWDYKGRMPVRYRRIRNFMEELVPTILADQVTFQAEYSLQDTPVPLGQSFDLSRVPVAEGAVWGRTWQSGYFRLTATVPEAWKGKDLAAWLDVGGEGLIYDRKGVPLYGITNGSAFADHYAKDVYRIAPKCQGGEVVELWLEAAANNLFGVDTAKAPAKKSDPDRHGTWEAKVGKVRLCTINEEVWGLYLDVRYLFQLWESLDWESVRATRILRALFEVTTRYQDNPDHAAACRALLAKEIHRPTSSSQLATTAVGHAHIDTAWLWQLKESRRKVGRTFASQIALIERYPGYVFGASTPQHYQWAKEDYPELYDKVRQAVADGTWEPLGAMWVEADCNLISGESMVRQIVHGKNFWKEEFDLDVRNCWIPDVFGYAATMPQILRKSGVDFFLTQKLSWSKNNEFPHDTFVWRGIDGTEILTHFPPEHTYNSFCQPQDLRTAEKTFHEKDRIDEFLTLMGIGDGGGGPKEEHLEHILRAKDSDGVPRASFGRADALFARLQAAVPLVETWVGELYLEYHRGTYTTQAKTKKNNRRLELDLFAVESLWSHLPLDQYPSQKLDAVVKVLLLHQFHDIIPGSSIHAVYNDADEAYAGALAVLDGLRAQAFEALGQADDGLMTYFNPLAVEWSGTVSVGLEGTALVDGTGARWPIQAEADRLVAHIQVPAQGFVTLRAEGPRPAPQVPPFVPVLENALVRYRFDDGGHLVEAFDKVLGRNVLKPGVAGNVLSFYEDTPHNFEAWDIDFYYIDQKMGEAKLTSAAALPGGSVRRGLRFEYTVGQSRLVQDVTLEDGATALSFHTQVDWNESRRMLRVAFPVDSVATEAACEIAYGFVKRPTHANTEWDFAKFEVCAHRWVDIGDAHGGVALLNDGKYGHRVRDNVLDLCLLRSPLFPDPDADLGRHEFTYVLFPHAGDLSTGAVQTAAAQLNRPPLAWSGRVGEASTPVRVAGQGFSLEAVKRAEREDALVVRVVENRGLRTSICLQSDAYSTVAETDLVEWNDQGRSSLDGPLTVALAPFEIRTFKLWPKEGGPLSTRH